MPLGKEHLLPPLSPSLFLCVHLLCWRSLALEVPKLAVPSILPLFSPLHNVATVASAPQPPGPFSGGSTKFV